MEVNLSCEGDGVASDVVLFVEPERLSVRRSIADGILVAGEGGSGESRADEGDDMDEGEVIDGEVIIEVGDVVLSLGADLLILLKYEKINQRKRKKFNGNIKNKLILQFILTFLEGPEDFSFSESGL